MIKQSLVACALVLSLAGSAKAQYYYATPSTPAYTAPTVIYNNSAPVYYAPPTYAAPVYAPQPVYQQPVYAAPVYAAPVYAAPVYDYPYYNRGYYSPLSIGLDFGFGGGRGGDRHWR